MKADMTRLAYMPQLDGIRAIAVGMVIISHWQPAWSIFKFLGPVGVQIFFVLSGFLITRILLETRTKLEVSQAGVGKALKVFFIRRFLRLMPLYYLTLLIMYAIGAPNVVSFIIWHVCYTTNFKIAQAGWIGEASHLWSLAVEEQFYLIWPFVILLIPRKYLLPTIVGFIFLSPVFKLLHYLYSADIDMNVLPVTAFLTLGTGALLNFVKNFPIFNQKAIYSTALVSLFIYFFSIIFNNSFLFSVIQEVAFTLFLGGVVYGAANGYKGLVGFILSSPPIVFIGKISYGLYLLHNFIPYLTSTWLISIGLPSMKMVGTYGFFAINSLLLFLLCVLSWLLFESKINSLKSRYPYSTVKQVVNPAPRIIRMA